MERARPDVLFPNRPRAARGKFLRVIFIKVRGKIMPNQAKSHSLQPDPAAVQITLPGTSDREGHHETLLGGKLVVKTPFGLKPLDRMLIEGSEAVPATRILSVMVPNTIPALALSALRSEAEVYYYHLDLFHVGQAEMQAGGHRLKNFRGVCEPDIPRLVPAPELILSEFRHDNEGGLVLELIRQAHERLARGGKLLATTNNPLDQWLRRQLEKTFGNLTLVSKTKHGLLYSAKRTDKAADNGEGELPPALHFIKHIEVFFEGEKLAFETCYGTFSSEDLDEGSRALLDVMVPPEPCQAILDLGCGWGGMGILAARKSGAKKLTMIDANARAVEMARRNAQRHGLEEAQVRLEADVESIQAGGENGLYDAVVSNPPYATEFRVTDLFIAMAWRALRPGGKVWLVGKNNEHMTRRTEEVFGNVEVLRRRGYSVVTAIRQDTRVYS